MHKNTFRYVKDGFDADNASFVGLGKAETARIHSQLRPEWSANIVMRKLLSRLMQEAAVAHAR